MANSLLPRPDRPILNAVVLLLLFLPPVAASVSRESVLSQCTRALYRGDYLEATQIAQGFLRKFPADVGLRVLLGRAELAQSQLQPALVELRKALSLDPHSIDALYYLSFTARALSQAEYQRLFAMQPDSPRVHQLLAEAALESQDQAQAEAEFQKALAGNPASAEVANELAELKRSQSKFDEAIDYYTQAQKIAPLNYTVAYGLGACYTYKQDYPRAIEWLHKAVALAPDSTAGHFALGNALFQSGQFEAAIPELKISLRLEPRMRQAYFLLGRAYTRLGRRDEANAAFQKLDQLDRSAVPGQTRGQPDNASGKPEISR